MMKIAINTTSAVYGGGVTYIKHLLEHLAKIDINNEYVVLTTPQKKQEFDFIANHNFRTVSINFLKSPFLRVLWEQLGLPIFIKRNKIGLLYSPANVVPVFLPSKSIVMIQNLAPFFNGAMRAQSLYQKVRLILLKFLSIVSVKRADGIIFISNYAKELLFRYRFNREKTYVVYHGKNELFREDININRVGSIKNELGIKGDYILFVSNLYQYKNVLELVEAFGRINNKIKDDLQLVIAGEFSDTRYLNKTRGIIDKYDLSERVLLSGSVVYDKLAYLYAGCSLFVFTSTCENCPNILIEAMSCGTPIISSNMTSMPEICKDAAIYFNPDNPDDIADKILMVLKDTSLQKELRVESLARSKDFSWKRTARDTLNVFEEVYSS